MKKCTNKFLESTFIWYKNKIFNFKTLKIMNLENLNLVELNAQEVQEVEGGFAGLIIAAIGTTAALGLIAGSAYYFYTH